MKSQLKEALEVAKSKARSLKTKKAQAKAWAKVREIEHEILFGEGGLYEQAKPYAVHSVKGTVRRFYAGCEDVLVDTTEYGSMWVSICSDVLTKSWYPHTSCIEFTEGQEVVLEITIEVNSDRLCLNAVPGHISGGKVNEEQYAELCKNTNLAFFKYPNSNGVTGLFASNVRGA